MKSPSLLGDEWTHRDPEAVAEKRKKKVKKPKPDIDERETARAYVQQQLALGKIFFEFRRFGTPQTRHGCLPMIRERREGKLMCPHIMCTMHLFGRGLAHRPDSEMMAAFTARLEGKTKDCCALDMVEDGIPVDADTVALLLGSPRARVPQILAEAVLKLNDSPEIALLELGWE